MTVSGLITGGKNLEEGNLIVGKFCDFAGNFVIFRGKIKKYIREIFHPGGKSFPDFIYFFSKPGFE